MATSSAESVALREMVRLRIDIAHRLAVARRVDEANQRTAVLAAVLLRLSTAQTPPQLSTPAPSPGPTHGRQQQQARQRQEREAGRGEPSQPNPQLRPSSKAQKESGKTSLKTDLGVVDSLTTLCWYSLCRWASGFPRQETKPVTQKPNP
jgi:hypothetical protein